MNPLFNDNPADVQLDQAIANRLSKLRSMPVDTSSLDRALRRQVPAPPARGGMSWLLSIRPLRAVAASVAILLVISAILISTISAPAMASPTQMAQFHRDLVAGVTPAMRVDSIDAANRALAAQSPQSPQVPDVPAQHVMACCMKSVKNKKVACVLLKDNATPVTLTVANASDMKTPEAGSITRGGVSYNVQSVGSLNMVMTERHDKWICLIGELSADRLMDIADQLQF